MKIGGQALIEGVLIMAPDRYAMAARLPDGKIKTKVMKHKSVTKRSKLLGTPFLRGIIYLYEMVVIGSKALTWSAEQQGEEQMKPWELVVTFGGAILLTIGIFVVAPYYAAKIFVDPPGFVFNVLDGVFRLIALFAYLFIIGLMKDVKRMFEYHGAEHMSVYCHEHGEELTPENVAKFQKEHPRCGTALLVYVVAVSILVFSILHTPYWYVNITGRILLIPIVAGISYELLKLAARVKWLSWLSLPGIWTQKLTTHAPDKEQIEVAIAAVKAAT